MTKQEFDDLLSGKKQYNTAWESAILACEGLHLMTENIQKMKENQLKNDGLANGISNVQRDIENFAKETAERVAKVLESTPYVLQPLKTPPRIVDQLKNFGPVSKETGHFQTNLVVVADALTSPETKKEALPPTTAPTTKTESSKDLEALADSLSQTLVATTNMEVSPMKISSQSLDELATTPDDKARQDFIQGIRNINYDIDFSDNSAENSVMDDIGIETKTSNMLLGVADSSSMDMLSTHSLDLDNLGTNTGIGITLMDTLDSPGATSMLLESPIKPFSTGPSHPVVDYKGFSVLSNIPTISCTAGTGQKSDCTNGGGTDNKATS